MRARPYGNTSSFTASGSLFEHWVQKRRYCRVSQASLLGRYSMRAPHRSHRRRDGIGERLKSPIATLKPWKQPTATADLHKKCASAAQTMPRGAKAPALAPPRGCGRTFQLVGTSVFSRPGRLAHGQTLGVVNRVLLANENAAYKHAGLSRFVANNRPSGRGARGKFIVQSGDAKAHSHIAYFRIFLKLRPYYQDHVA